MHKKRTMVETKRIHYLAEFELHQRKKETKKERKKERQKERKRREREKAERKREREKAERKREREKERREGGRKERKKDEQFAWAAILVYHFRNVCQLRHWYFHAQNNRRINPRCLESRETVKQRRFATAP